MGLRTTGVMDRVIILIISLSVEKQLENEHCPYEGWHEPRKWRLIPDHEVPQTTDFHEPSCLLNPLHDVHVAVWEKSDLPSTFLLVVAPEGPQNGRGEILPKLFKGNVPVARCTVWRRWWENKQDHLHLCQPNS